MPVWLQLTAALSAAVASGVMGIAFVPFLRKLQMFEPKQENAEQTGEQRKPLMCGLLILFGMLFGMVLGFTLYREFGNADRTSADYAEQMELLRLLLIHGSLSVLGGLIIDWMVIRGRLRYRIRPVLLMGAVFLVTLALLLWQGNRGFFLISASVLAAVCWQLIRSTEKETDGVTLSVNAVQLLTLTVPLLHDGQYAIALFTLTTVGACWGSMIWNLHPAKCRLGETGSCLFGSIVPMVCIMEGYWKALALCMAVYVLNALPYLRYRSTLLTILKQNKTAAWKQITLFAGLALFCGIMQLL